MRTPPRRPDARLFDAQVLLRGVVQGCGLFGIVLVAYLVARSASGSDETARALAFTVLVVSNLALIHVNRTWTRHRDSTRPWNAAFGWIASATCVLLAACAVGAGCQPTVHVHHAVAPLCADRCGALSRRACLVRGHQVARGSADALTWPPTHQVMCRAAHPPGRVLRDVGSGSGHRDEGREDHRGQCEKDRPDEARQELMKVGVHGGVLGEGDTLSFDARH